MNKKQKVPLLFYYEGINKNGIKMTGNVEAHTLALAKVDLRRQGIITHKVIQKRKPLFHLSNKTIKSSDITLFCRQLATLTEAGVPLIQSFDIIAKGQTNPNFKSLIETITNNIETGHTLTESLKKHPDYFNDLICNLINAGEKSGSLDILLNKIASYKEKMESIKKKIKKTLTYPLAVLIIACIVTSGLLIVVVPQFESLFKGFGAELPAMTRAVIILSQLMQTYWYYLLGVVASLSYAFVYAKKHLPWFAERIDQLLLQIPIIGTILEQAAIARFTRTLSITFAAGLPLIEALKSVAGTTGNILYAKATEQIRLELSTGQQLNNAMKHTCLFPNTVTQMVAIGEESGTLEKMLSKVADFYEEDVNNAVDALSSLLEPIIMSILGLVVGGLVIAMYLPVFKLGSVV